MGDCIVYTAESKVSRPDGQMLARFLPLTAKVAYKNRKVDAISRSFPRKKRWLVLLFPHHDVVYSLMPSEAMVPRF